MVTNDNSASTINNYIVSCICGSYHDAIVCLSTVRHLCILLGAKRSHEMLPTNRQAMSRTFVKFYNLLDLGSLVPLGLGLQPLQQRLCKSKSM